MLNTPLMPLLSLRIKVLGSVTLMVALLMAFSVCAFADTEKVFFDIPEGRAPKSLKLVARQGEIDILFTGRTVQGLRTQSIEGYYNISEVLNTLLRDSGLSFLIDDESGAYAIVKSSSKEKSGTSETKYDDYPKMKNKKALGGFFRSILGISALGVQSAHSQDEQEDDSNVFIIAEMVVTGTATERTIIETPQSVNMVSDLELRAFTSSSQADVLSNIPGLKGEGGGGEVATNVFVRGLPSGGQYAFTPLEYDGIPVYSTFGLNSSAFDVYYRNDLGIDRLEYVSGGVSNLFGPGSVAGIINYVSKTGGPDDKGTLQFEVAEEGRFRTDYFTSGAVGGDDSNTFYALSGYYRVDEGPLKSGLDTEGMQLRGNLKREFKDGSGSWTLYGQTIDDRVQFFLPLPLDAASKERVKGNDGKTVYTANTAEASQLSYQTPDGRFESPIEDGVLTKGGSMAFALDKDLGNDWNLNVKSKYARYAHDFNLFLDGDGVVSVPETFSDFLAARDLGDTASASFTYNGSGQEVPTNNVMGGDTLLFANRVLDRQRDSTDFTTELNLTKKFKRGESEHSLTFGSFFARAEANDYNVITTYLADFRNQPMLVNLSLDGVMEDVDGNLVAAPGETFSVTQNGVLNANGITGDRERSAVRSAFYIADQIEANDRWSVDLGLRFESIDGDVFQRNLAQTRVGDDRSLNDDIEVMGHQTGSALLGDVSTSEWAASVSALYKASDNLSYFGNLSRGFFFPQIRSVAFNSLGEPGPYEGEVIYISELGAKFNKDRFQGYATLFFTNLEDRQSISFENGPNGSVINVVNKTSTESYGIELSGEYRLTDNWNFTSNLTLRKGEFTKFDGNPEFVGNKLVRQPDILFNAGALYRNRNVDFGLFLNVNGDNFANNSNNVELDSYELLRLEAGYTFQLDQGQTLRLGLSVYNLTDSEGITEGSPRAGNSQDIDAGGFFVGRPILPRRITLKATYDF